LTPRQSRPAPILSNGDAASLMMLPGTLSSRHPSLHADGSLHSASTTHLSPYWQRPNVPRFPVRAQQTQAHLPPPSRVHSQDDDAYMETSATPRQKPTVRMQLRRHPIVPYAALHPHLCTVSLVGAALMPCAAPSAGVHPRDRCSARLHRPSPQHLASALLCRRLGLCSPLPFLRDARCVPVAPPLYLRQRPTATSTFHLVELCSSCPRHPIPP
jgi:hypothetical protein